MSQQRRRAREARQEARRQEVEAAALARARQARRTALRRSLTPALPRRRRRFDSLTARAWSQLVAAFAAVQVVAWLFLPGYGPRVAVAVLTLASLAVIVTTRRSPSR